MEIQWWVLIGMGVFIFASFLIMYLKLNGFFKRFKRKK